MWTAKNRTFLQIGLGLIGTEISKRAQQLGFRVWGMQELPSFHRYCSKVLAKKDLHSILSSIDIVCLALPRDKQHSHWFALEELKLMKQDSILLLFGSGSAIDLQDLAQVASEGKFRGVGIDAHFHTSIPDNSPLRTLPQVFITPEIGPYPHMEKGQAFSGFLYNLRQFLHGNFTDMKNLVDESTLYSLKTGELE